MPWYEHWYDYTGTLADWAMAGSALGAYFLARDYFSDIAKKDGYELIKKLHLELLPSLKNNNTITSINVLDFEVHSYINGGVGVFDEDKDGNGNSRLRSSLLYDLNTLERQRIESIRLEREINEIIESLETFGWYMVEEKKIVLLNLLKITDNLFSHIHAIIIYLREILSREAPKFLPSDDNQIFSNYDPSNSNQPLYLQNIEVVSKKLINAQKMIYNHEKSTPYDQAISALDFYFKDGKHLKKFFIYKR
ncbi:hypothetical protein CI789_12065 [Erwinia persicina]|uniref:hypothetical protein n=1 Tax=Erwinia persicina TaxID=55211 RepID=UPI000E503183|nr:hypothetical protein [Erwinia persicina]AXU95904.1 hypothetical protein CI789_12065 [Erwinia persicina]